MAIPTPEQIRAGRKCWLPKMAVVPEQCASCPFRVGNDKEFGVIVTRLRRKQHLPKADAEAIRYAREKIKDDLQFSGDFACHMTAYSHNGNPRPREEMKQCAGAAEWFRNGGRYGEG